MKHLISRSDKCDVIHIHDWFGYGYLALLAKRQGWAFHNTVFIAGLHGPKFWAMLGTSEIPHSQLFPKN